MYYSILMPYFEFVKNINQLSMHENPLVVMRKSNVSGPIRSQYGRHYPLQGCIGHAHPTNGQ